MVPFPTDEEGEGMARIAWRGPKATVRGESLIVKFKGAYTAFSHVVTTQLRNVTSTVYLTHYECYLSSGTFTENPCESSFKVVFCDTGMQNK